MEKKVIRSIMFEMFTGMFTCYMFTAVHNQESSLSPPSLFVKTGVGNSFLGTLNIVHPLKCFVLKKMSKVLYTLYFPFQLPCFLITYPNSKLN